MKKKAFRAAFPHTLPICVGFLNDTILMQTFCRMVRYEEGEKMCNAENIDCRG